MRTWKEMRERIRALEMDADSREIWYRNKLYAEEAARREAENTLSEIEETRREEKAEFLALQALVRGVLERIEPASGDVLSDMRLKVAISLLGGETFDLVAFLSKEHANRTPAVTPQPGSTLPMKEPKYGLWMTRLGNLKIPVIKEIKALTGLGLKEAKDMSEAFLPVLIKDGMSEMEARRAKALFEEAGATVEIR